jgi:hypothetical protein
MGRSEFIPPNGSCFKALAVEGDRFDNQLLQKS